MELINVVLLLTVSTAVQLEPQSSPAFLFVGKWYGEILRCLFDNPNECETFHEGADTVTSRVLTTAVHGKYLFAALSSKSSAKILRCQWSLKHSCAVYHETEGYVYSLAVFKGYLYTGGSSGGSGDKGQILRCELNQPNSCNLVHTSPEPVTDMYVLGKYIYFTAYQSSVFYCSNGAIFRCSKVLIDKLNTTDVMRSSHLGNTIITLASRNAFVRFYNLTSRGSMNIIKEVPVDGYFRSVKVFRRKIYILLDTNDIKTSDGIGSKFNDWVRYDGIRNIMFMYATHSFNVNAYETSNCFEQRSPLRMFNYDVKNRAMLEVRVVGGLLRDARGAAVDTRHADIGYSGPAAVFAMGPDGQLLLSHAHRFGLVHISSLFAGQPVSGAGEIVVEDGVVKRIIACSVNYWPDIELNKQVVDELYKQGYDRADEINLETCEYTCDRNYVSEWA